MNNSVPFRIGYDSDFKILSIVYQIFIIKSIVFLHINYHYVMHFIYHFLVKWLKNLILFTYITIYAQI